MTSTKSLGWIGEFPASWDVMPNKALIRKKKVSVGAKADDYPLLSLTKGGVIVRNLDEGGKFPENFDSYQRVSAGDLVTCLFDVPETPRTIGLSKHDGMITGAYDVFEFSDRVNPRYFEYYYLALDDRKGLSYFYSGLRNVIRTPVFLSIPTPVPPLDEQGGIADFLDRELAQIDALIAKQDEVLENLRQRRSAVILSRVCGNAKIEAPSARNLEEFFTGLPRGWHTQPLKGLIIRNDGGAWGEDPSGDQSDVVVLRSTEQTILGEWEIVDPAIRSLSSKEYAATRLMEGDIVLTKSSGSLDHIGKCTLVTNNSGAIDASYSNFMQRLRPKPGISSKFIWWYLNSEAAKVQWRLNSTSTTGLGNLNSTVISNLRVPVPPQNSQNEIATQIDEDVRGIDALISSSLNSIELFIERRQSLISAAVTGKIDVRKVA